MMARVREVAIRDETRGAPAQRADTVRVENLVRAGGRDELRRVVAVLDETAAVVERFATVTA